jgi:hypothetical protein
MKIKKCYICNRKLSSNPPIVVCNNGKYVKVGMDCYEKVKNGDIVGYKILPKGLSQKELNNIKTIN